MTSLPIYVRVRSEYETSDMSRYRFGLTDNILSQSLRKQTCQDFTIVLLQRSEDPLFTKRIRSLSVNGRLVIHDDGLEYPRIEVNVGDDDFLGPDFIQKIRECEEFVGNGRILFPNGFLFYRRRCFLWRNHPDQVKVDVIFEPGKFVFENVIGSLESSWIYCRHWANSNPIDETKIRNEVQVKWSGWQQNIVHRYCDADIKTGTAANATVSSPRRVIIPREKKGQRRR